MNTTLTRDTRHETPSTPVTAARSVRPLGVFDRLALHLGVALIRWGRRPGRELARYERRANEYERALLRRENEAARRQLEHARAQQLVRML